MALRQSKYVPNLYSVLNADFTDGIPFRRWENRGVVGGERVVTGFEMVVYLGDKAGVGPFKIVPLSKSHQPALDYATHRALSGTFKTVSVDGKDKLVLSSRDENDGAIYAYVRTGLMVDKKGIDGIELAIDKYIMNNDSNFFIPGSYSLDGQSSLASADVEVLTEEKAKKIKGLGGKGHKLIGGSVYRHDLWRIAEGSSILVQELDGRLYRIVNEGNTIALRDASDPAYAQLFQDFVTRGREEAAKVREARRTARQQKESDQTPADATAEQPAAELAAQEA